MIYFNGKAETPRVRVMAVIFDLDGTLLDTKEIFYDIINIVFNKLNFPGVGREALAEAADKIVDYCQHRPLPFYPWLRQIAWQRLVHQHEHHLWTAKRSVSQEQKQIH